MTETLERPSDGASSPGRGSTTRFLVPILLQIGAMIGLGALLYPSGANWFASLHHDSEVSGYVREVESMPDEGKLEKLNAARQYNDRLPTGVLRDPYLEEGTGSTDEAQGSAYAAYEEVMSLNDTGVIGQLTYPRLGIGLPIYHGTSDEVISGGVGHLYGSSLPVGGSSTHSVLTAHAGLVNASLFTPLHNAEVGDTFQISTLGETLYYKVDGIETIYPEETDRLRITDGEDRVTLFTCTPIGHNSHRLLVNAVRTEAPAAGGTHVIEGDGGTAGFPWWLLGFLGGSAAIASILFVIPRLRTTTTDPAAPAVDHPIDTDGAHTKETRV